MEIDTTVLLCAIGLVLTGAIMGYPLGHTMAQRDRIRPALDQLDRGRRAAKRYGVLTAKTLEVKHRD